MKIAKCRGLGNIIEAALGKKAQMQGANEPLPQYQQDMRQQNVPQAQGQVIAQVKGDIPAAILQAFQQQVQAKRPLEQLNPSDIVKNLLSGGKYPEQVTNAIWYNNAISQDLVRIANESLKKLMSMQQGQQAAPVMTQAPAQPQVPQAPAQHQVPQAV
jgi:hypothetical protein